MSRICSKCNLEKELNYDNFQPIKKSGRFRSECRDCGKIMTKSYKARNKGKISVYNKTWKSEHKEEVKEYNHEYFIANQPAIQKRNSVNQRKYYKVNPNHRYAVSLRRRMNETMNGKKLSSTWSLLGCDAEFFVNWIEYQLEGTEYNFENYGTLWHLDHVMPCASFNLEILYDQITCCHWSNYQPLGCFDNLSKGGKIDIGLIRSHNIKARTFLNSLSEEITKKVTVGPVLLNKRLM